jgi:glycosyltransferase involved in cell wall biosynthesis
MANIILFVSSMEGGGAERVAAMLANHWAADGHAVSLVATYSGRGTSTHDLHDGVELIFLADLVSLKQQSLRNRLVRLKAMRDLIRQTQPDVVLSFLSRVNVAVLLATLGLGIRVVVSERIFPPLHPVGPITAWLRAWLYPKAATVVMQTRKGTQWLARAMPKCNGEVIYNPVLHPLPDSRAAKVATNCIPQTAHLILGVGRLVAQKDFDQLIKAFAETAPLYSDWHLVILGEGEEKTALQAKITELNLQDRVHLPGQAGNLAEWYERADIFAMSSRYEGFPNALLEAMSYGLPAVSTACDTGPEEIIEHGVNGLLVPLEKGYQGFSQALGDLMADARLRRTLGDTATAVIQRFALEEVSKQWDRVLGVAPTAQGRR